MIGLRRARDLRLGARLAGFFAVFFFMDPSYSRGWIPKR
jgi:hypothetical protein